MNGSDDLSRERHPGRRAEALVDAVETVRDVNRLVRDVLHDGVTLVCDAAASPLLVDIPRRQLEQVLLNLIFYSQDRLTAPGIIRVDLTNLGQCPPAGPQQGALSAAGFLRLRVIDDGPELPTEDAARLFEIGDSGRSLGLAVAQGIVQNAGGRIMVEQGAGFTAVNVFLPLVVSPPRPAGTR